jgi:membrane protein required for colicin V production
MSEWGLALGPYVFNLVDVVIVVIAFLAAVVGSIRGFALEFSSRAGFLVGFVVALMFSRLGSSLLEDTFELPLLATTLIAFVILFLIGYLLMMMVGSLLDRTLDALGLEWLDRLEIQSVVDLSAYLDPSVITNQVIKPLTPVGMDLVKGIL